MSCKSVLSNNSFNQSTYDPPLQPWMKTQPPNETNVKFAGEEAKDRLYEPKHKKKLVRVLTVVAYVFSVSLAAIMLSLYYVFIWNPNPKTRLVSDASAKPPKPSCNVLNVEATTNEINPITISNDSIFYN